MDSSRKIFLAQCWKCEDYSGPGRSNSIMLSWVMMILKLSCKNKMFYLFVHTISAQWIFNKKKYHSSFHFRWSHSSQGMGSWMLLPTPRLTARVIKCSITVSRRSTLLSLLAWENSSSIFFTSSVLRRGQSSVTEARNVIVKIDFLWSIPRESFSQDVHIKSHLFQ